MNKIVMVLVFGLVNCGTASPKLVRSPNGNIGYNLECQRSRENCLAQINELCKDGGYYILSESSHPGGLFADWFPGPITWFNISIQCGSPPADYTAPPQAQQNIYIPPPKETAPSYTCQKQYNQVECRPHE